MGDVRYVTDEKGKRPISGLEGCNRRIGSTSREASNLNRLATVMS